MRIYSRKESLSRALLQVPYVFRLSDTYLLLLGELGAFAVQVLSSAGGIWSPGEYKLHLLRHFPPCSYNLCSFSDFLVVLVLGISQVGMCSKL